jgi:hypothetical protein
MTYDKGEIQHGRVENVHDITKPLLHCIHRGAIGFWVERCKNRP